MKKLVILPVAVGIALAGCGSSHKAQLQQAQNVPQVKQAEVKAQAIYHHCVRHPLSLVHNPAARERALACAVPPKNRTAAIQCVEKGIGVHPPTKARVEHVVVNCLEKYS